MSKTNNLKYENEQLLLHKRNGATITPKRERKEEVGDNVGEDETATFINTPVQLTPGWESTNVGEDELNFKTLNFDDVNLEMNPPKDKLNIVYFIFLIHGIGILTSWNMFVTGKDYFVNFKLSKNYTRDDETKLYATYFLGCVGFAAQGPNVLLNWLNIFIKIGGNLTKRIVWGIFILACIFLFTILLAMLDTSEYPGAFFWLTMCSVVILNTANGIYQSSVFGMAASLPPKYTGAVILGCNICGVLTTLVSIAANTFTSNKRTAAIYYFITALFILLICFDTYFGLPLNRFYRYNQLLNKRESEKKLKDNQQSNIPYWKIYKQAFPQLFNVFFTYFVTLVIFPAIQSDIKRTDPNFIVNDNLFVLITCFLTFNIFAAVGSFLVNIIGVWPKQKNLIICVCLRLIFIPLFILMNYRPAEMERTLPIVFNNDWFYWAMSALMALTSGYFGAIGMMYVPMTVEPQYAGTAGMFGSAMLVMGIVAGILFSFLGPIVVTKLYI